MSQQQKDKIAQANKGKKLSPEIRNKISKSLEKYWSRLPMKPTTSTSGTTGPTNPLIQSILDDLRGFLRFSEESSHFVINPAKQTGIRVSLPDVSLFPSDSAQIPPDLTRFPPVEVSVRQDDELPKQTGIRLRRTDSPLISSCFVYDWNKNNSNKLNNVQQSEHL